MKKIFTMSFVMLCMVFQMQADPVSKFEAKQIAISWYGRISQTSVTDVAVEGITVTQYEGLTTFYIFRFRPNGFVLVAADDASIPILGYSAHNDFPEEVTNPAVKEWLDDYSREIAYIVSSGKSNRETIKRWNAIRMESYPESTMDVGPLLATAWHQNCYYNELCPADPAGPCGHAWAGCVATAMAQIMKYHNFPPQGVGLHSYTHPDYGVQSADFGNTFYDWASMFPTLSSSTIPVATIMYHAGVSVDMNYSPGGSGSWVTFVPGAMVDYFNYHPAIERHYQSEYSDPEEWKELLRDNLDEGLPVYYIGRSPTTGHAFVCDGYKVTEGDFHFNWGWSGNHDGWYAIGALNPGTTTWNLKNNAIVWIKPYNPDLIVRFLQPASNTVIRAGDAVTIEASVVRGTSNQVLWITINGITVASGAGPDVSYIWNTSISDLGSNDVKAWAVAGNDTVWYMINLNVAEWQTQASGFPVYKRAIHSMSAVDTNIVWAVARDGINLRGTPYQDFTRTVDGGNTWSTGRITPGDGLCASMIFALSANKAYVPMWRMLGTDPAGIYVTEDGGMTWNRQNSATFNNPGSLPMCVHLFNENEGWCMGSPPTYTGSEFEIFTTTDGGEDWIQVSGSNIPDPNDGEKSFTGAYSAVGDTIWYGTNRGRIYRSVDKGHTWTVSMVLPLYGWQTRPVFRDAMHGIAHNLNEYPETPRICETSDGGETWTLVDFDGSLYGTDLAYIPGTEDTWVSTGGRFINPTGASVSYDGGYTWTEMPGTSGVFFRYMTWISPTCGWAGGINRSETEGGVFRFTGNLLNPPIGITQSEIRNQKSEIRNYPNPFYASTTIVFELEEPGETEVIVYNQFGQEVDKMDINGKKGSNKVNWYAGSLPAGIYICRIKTGNRSGSKKIVLLR